MAARRMGLGRFGITVAACLLLATSAAAVPDAFIDSIRLDAPSCSFEVAFKGTEASDYFVNVWDDGNYRTGAGGTFGAAELVTVRITIGGPILQGAAGIGIYVENGLGVAATATYDADGSYQYPPEVGDACQALGFTFTAAVVEATTTTTPTTTSSTTTTTSPPGELLSGERLLLQPSRLTLLSKYRTFTLGRGAGSPDDPVAAGGSLRVLGAGFDRTFALPASAWKYISTRKPEKGYRLAGASPVMAVLVKAGKLIKVAAKGEGLDIPLAADVQPVQAELRLGERRYCFTFGGEVRWKAGKQWLAVKAPTAAACPP